MPGSGNAGWPGRGLAGRLAAVAGGLALCAGAGCHAAARPERLALFDPQQHREAVQSLLRRVLDEWVWIPLHFGENAYIVADGFRLTPRQDGYLHLAGMRPR